MRDQRFDLLTPLLHQNHHHPDPHQTGHMQDQFQHHRQPSKFVRSSPDNPFGNGFSSTAGFSTAAQAGSIHDSVGEKRNISDENADCNLLQSSLKRVRLSRSPGEFRLERDLKTLDAMEWGSSHVAANALNFSSTTWIHRSTGTRLTMADSLRICLFLPLTAMEESGPFSTGVNPEQQYQHHLHSYHRDYRWRIMIQIPRMYPHNPPVVTRIDGLSLESIGISEAHPDVRRQSNGSRNANGRNESDGASSLHSTQGVNTSEPIFFTESQLARSSSSTTITSAETQNTTSVLSINGSGKTIDWNHWSPITSLGELLDFLLGAATSNLSTSTMNAAAMTTNANSMAVTTARMSSSSSSSLSSVSSASSSSSWGNRNHNNNDSNGRALSFLRWSGNNTVAETMMTDENATTASIRTNVSGASFLSPNRFDVGYGKSGVGNRFVGTAGTTPRTTNASVWQQHLQCLGKQGEDDVGMDMS